MNSPEILTPEALPISKTTAVFGLSRTAIYQLAKSRKIKLLKFGKRTLVDVHSVRSFLETLPDVVLDVAPRNQEPTTRSSK